MKISIITAVYNGSNAIAKTLQSVARQDYAAIEHIIVDGASTDSTLATVHEHMGRVARVVSEPDQGIYDAFNKGLRLATGDLIAYLNCGDTYLGDDIVTRMAALFEPDHRIEAAFADALIVDPKDTDRVLRRYRSKWFRPGSLAYGFMPAHPTMFLRRDVYSRVGEYNPLFRIAGDYELCLRIFEKGTVAYRYLDEPIVRMPSGGLSNQGWRSKLLITREMRAACSMNDIDTNMLKLCLRFPLKLLEMV